MVAKNVWLVMRPYAIPKKKVQTIAVSPILVSPKRSEQYARKEPLALIAQPLPTSALPVGEASLPGLVSSATSGHTVEIY